MYGNRVRDNSKKASKVKFWLRYLDSLRQDRKKFLICFSYNFEFTKGFCVLYPSKSYYKVASMICTIKCPWGLDQVKDGEGLWEVPISSPNGGKIFYLLKKKRISTIKSDCLQTSISSKAPFDCQKENYWKYPWARIQLLSHLLNFFPKSKHGCLSQLSSSSCLSPIQLQLLYVLLLHMGSTSD